MVSASVTQKEVSETPTFSSVTPPRIPAWANILVTGGYPAAGLMQETWWEDSDVSQASDTEQDPGGPPNRIDLSKNY